MNISTICRTQVVSVEGNESLVKAAQLMKDNKIGDVVVLEKNKPIGILTDRDIVVRVATNADNLENFMVKDVMSSNLLLLKDTDGIAETIKKLSEKHVRRAPIVDSNNKIVGIATVDDLIPLLIDELKYLGDLIKEQVKT